MDEGFLSTKYTNFVSVDLIDIKPELNDMLSIYNFINNSLESAGMKQICKPVLVPYYYGKVENDCGISCYAFFEGGYCTFHIFERRRIAYFDIMATQKLNKALFEEQLPQFCATKNLIVNSNIEKTQKHAAIFGPHYICYGTPKEIFNTDSLLFIQEKVITAIKMTAITTPTIVKMHDSLLTFIAIAESHVAITLRKNEIQIDIFSCKPFDSKKLENILSQFIEIRKTDFFYRVCADSPSTYTHKS